LQQLLAQGLQLQEMLKLKHKLPPHQSGAAAPVVNIVAKIILYIRLNLPKCRESPLGSAGDPSRK
jgi:hypothetical protein